MPIIHDARALLAAAGRALADVAEPNGQPRPSGVAPTSKVTAALRRLLAAPPAALVQPDFEAQRLAGVQVEPQVRTFMRWTPADLRTAMIQADGGNLRMAADLCDAILGDDRAPAVMATRVNAVLGSELNFEAGFGRARKTKRAIKALEAGEDWYQAFDEAVIGYMLCWGRLLGVSLAQENWGEFADHKGRLIPVAENWHARHLRWDPRERQWYVKVGDGGDEVKAAPGDGKWIIFTPYGKNRPWSMGLWRGMSRLWLLKQYAIDDWGQTGKKQAEGIKAAFPPATGDPKHGNAKVRRELASDIAELAEGGTIVLPPGFDLKMVEQTANNWETFKAQIDMANAGMSILAIGSNLPTEVANAAQTGATAQTLVRLDYKKADAEALSTMAHDQSLSRWAEFNFGDAQLAPWPDWEVEPPADLQARANLVNTVATSLQTFQQASAPVDVRALLEEFEIEQTEDTPQPMAPPTDALQKIADAHNLLHGNRPATVELLSVVWKRGASIAPAQERTRWAMGRVNAFLHLLATGVPEHPEYTADDDLLPVVAA